MGEVPLYRSGTGSSRSGIPLKSVKLSFAITNMQDKVTDLYEN